VVFKPGVLDSNYQPLQVSTWKDKRVFGIPGQGYSRFDAAEPFTQAPTRGVLGIFHSAVTDSRQRKTLRQARNSDFAVNCDGYHCVSSVPLKFEVSLLASRVYDYKICPARAIPAFILAVDFDLQAEFGFELL
jgi:hypothetical protein